LRAGPPSRRSFSSVCRRSHNTCSDKDRTKLAPRALMLAHRLRVTSHFRTFRRRQDRGIVVIQCLAFLLLLLRVTGSPLDFPPSPRPGSRCNPTLPRRGHRPAQVSPVGHRTTLKVVWWWPPVGHRTAVVVRWDERESSPFESRDPVSERTPDGGFIGQVVAASQVIGDS
jgi:hypothetical protein